MKRLNSLLSNIAKLLSLLLCLALSTTVAKTSNLYDDFQAEYWDLEDDDDWFFKDNDETEEYDTYDDEYLDDYHDQTISEVSYEKVIWGTCFLILGVGGIIGLYKTYTNVPLQHNPLSDKRETTPIPQEPPKKPKGLDYKDFEQVKSEEIEDVAKTLAIPKEKEKLSSSSIYNNIKKEENIPNFPGDKIIYTQYSPNKEWLVVATKILYNIDLYLCNLKTKEWYLLQDLGRDKKDSSNHIRKDCCLAFSRDSQYLAAYGVNQSAIYVWKVSTQQLMVAHNIKRSLVFNKKSNKWIWQSNEEIIRFSSLHNLYFDKKGTLNFLFACPKAENTHHYELVKWSLPREKMVGKIGSLFENKPPSKSEQTYFYTKVPFSNIDNIPYRKWVKYDYYRDGEFIRINKNNDYIALCSQPSKNDSTKTQYIDVWKDEQYHLHFAVNKLKNIFFCGENEEVLGVYTKDNTLVLVNLGTKKGMTITLPDTIGSVSGSSLYFECYQSIDYKSYKDQSDYGCDLGNQWGYDKAHQDCWRSRQKQQLDIYQLERNGEESIGYKIKKVANIDYNLADRIISKRLNINIEYKGSHHPYGYNYNIYDFSINPTNWQIESVQEIIAGKLPPNNKKCKFNHPKD